MSIIPWRRFDELDRFFGEDFPVSIFNGKDLVPATNLYETDSSVVAEMSIPGMKPEDIEATVSNGIIRVKGTTKETIEDKEKGYWRKEIRSGSFERVFHIPVAVDEARATAEIKNGILNITIPKLKDSKSEAKKIQIKS